MSQMPSFLRALPPYPGGKRRLLPGIFALIKGVSPPASWPTLTFADPFLGGGAVALAAKAQGFGHIVANDIAGLQAHKTLAELARLLPEDEAQLEATLELLDFDVDGLLARLTEEADRAAAEGPQLLTFAVDAEDAPLVEAALEAAASDLSGRNRRGRALVILVQCYLAETTGGTTHVPK
jgi:hypothetical protein